MKPTPSLGIRLATKLNALTGVCAVIALTGTWLLLDRMQAKIEARDMAVAIGALFLILLATGVMIARHIVRPIYNLTRIVSRVSAEKDYSLRAQRYSHDEVGLLTDGFNDMLGEIQNQTTDLERSRQELADFLDNATEGLHWLDPDGRILWVNRGELRASGYEPTCNRPALRRMTDTGPSICGKSDRLFYWR